MGAEGLSNNNIKTKKMLFQSLEEEQKQINKDNMQLLGLNIQKISYSQKGNNLFKENEE
jgi:hypothetical protein